MAPEKITLMVCGSREGFSREEVEMDLFYLTENWNIPEVTLIHGGARGVDTYAGEWGHLNGVEIEVYEAEWDHFGKSAGYRRNSEMVRDADVVVAFWDGKSKGTKHSIDLALKARKELHVLYPWEERVSPT